MRLDFSKQFSNLDLSLSGNVEVGRRHNRQEGAEYDTLEYRLAGYWHPSRRASFGAYAYYNDDAILYASREKRMTAGGSIPTGMIPNCALPVAVNARLDNGYPFKLPRIKGATIAGQVQLFAPAANLLPSQTFRGRRGLFGVQPEIGREDLQPNGGLARVLITITDGEETMHRVTSPNGDFEFVGLKPGTWTVSLRHGDLPENAAAVEDNFSFDLGPGDNAQAEFRIEQRIRRMRMLSPLKVSAHINRIGTVQSG